MRVALRHRRLASPVPPDGNAEVLRLELDLEAPVASWIDDGRLPRASLRQLLNHTSGIPDYGRLPEYAAAVRDTPSEPWSDEELLARSLADPEVAAALGLG